MTPLQLTRRRFVHSAVAGGTILAVGAAAKPGDEPLLRFIQINDLHIQAPPQPDGLPKPSGYALANEKARWLVEAINRG